MINRFDFPGSDILKPKAEALVKPLLRLRTQATKAGMPIIYVNDNFREWHSEPAKIIQDADKKVASPALRRLYPRRDDYFLIKPQFSAFYSTNLPALLPSLGVSRLVLTGIATDICILFTAADAHMRGYQLWVPADCVAAERDERERWTLEVMAQAMSAEIASTDELALSKWLDRDGE